MASNKKKRLEAIADQLALQASQEPQDEFIMDLVSTPEGIVVNTNEAVDFFKASDVMMKQAELVPNDNNNAGPSWRIVDDSAGGTVAQQKEAKRQPRILGPAGKRSLEAKLPSKNKPQKVPTPSKMKHQVLKLPALVLKVPASAAKRSPRRRRNRQDRGSPGHLSSNSTPRTNIQHLMFTKTSSK